MKNLLLFISVFLISVVAFSQDPMSLPKTMVYGCVLHPIVTFDKEGSTFNFSNSYTVGIPVGINVIKTSRFGFSFELVPLIKSEKGVSKVSNIIFHPGMLFRLRHDFTFITRVAFETSGRYGFTPILNKVFYKKNNVSYFTAVPFPIRFGNGKPASFGVGFQFGMGF